jgi:uncharacterized protein YndB with AHSA1/START domain
MNAVNHRQGSAVITLPSDTEILITRAFDAPAELAYRAYTTPELVKQWWGFGNEEWLACEIDLRVGGTWRYLARNEGMEIGFHGEYRELDAPRRIVHTEIFEGAPDTGGDDVVDVVTFEEADGVTTFTTLVQCPSKEVRDTIIESGMESGMQVSYDRLEALLAEQA